MRERKGVLLLVIGARTRTRTPRRLMGGGYDGPRFKRNRIFKLQPLGFGINRKNAVDKFSRFPAIRIAVKWRRKPGSTTQIPRSDRSPRPSSSLILPAAHSPRDGPIYS